ncbi:MAG: TIGR03936 family radical SAM-associated protein [Lachnospiraceae bacterium]|nr:TIGR03936 family radical SAM-associated protein [Lachnospiraceae bacterium]
MKVRVKFAKYGAVRFIGHLDVMRYFQKAIRRAEIDVAYSEGFSPHQIMSFASPLSVGHTSEGEYFDLEVNSFTDREDFKSRLQSVMVEGIDILGVQPLSEGAANAMASVAAASYLAAFRDETILPAFWQDALLNFYQRPQIPVVKKTKKGEKEIDLKESIYELEIRDGVPKKGQEIIPGKEVYLLLNAQSGENIKPAFVLETFFQTLSFELPAFFLLIHRLETMQNIGTQEERKLVPLSWEK